MMLRLINDVEKALDSECYFSALALALTFPDICGKAEYPQERGTGKRYRDWYNEYIGKYEQCPCDFCQSDPMPYLSGEVVYSLRNSLLHQGTPNIEVSDIKNCNNKIDFFSLILESKKPFDIYGDFSSVSSNNTSERKLRSYDVNVWRLCLMLGRTAKGYYEDNKEKFDFFNYSIINQDFEIAMMKNSVV